MINLKETFAKFEDEFNEFHKVENPLSRRHDLCAFMILDKLLPDERDIVGGTEHEVFWLGVDCEKLAQVATEGDILTLVHCGVMYDDEYEGLKMFS